MNERIQKELELLKKHYSNVDYVEEGQWVYIKGYQIPLGLVWNREKTDVCFQIPVEYPGRPPYGFYVPAKILCNNTFPKNYKEPAPTSPPFQGTWGIFSWSPEIEWRPTANLVNGPNLFNFVDTFKNRFNEGI